MTKILYLDDEHVNLNLFKYYFSNTYKIYVATCSDKALKLLAEQPDINFVFSDLHMPDINGIDFIKKAKNKYPNIIYYLLTGSFINPQIQQAIDTNLIANCFNKPFRKDTIIDTVNQHISKLKLNH
ncbi:MAG: response regulator [Carboxylicivirga sp.]|jgi:CheY-like chemotaxis protein|nr:response regulator [Carboxylicivirga sp.]